jgi:hypothetical protein
MRISASCLDLGDQSRRRSIGPQAVRLGAGARAWNRGASARRSASTASAPPRMQPFEYSLENNRVVMRCILRAEDKRDRAVRSSPGQRFQHLPLRPELESVSVAELRPAPRVVTEPFPQRMGGTELLRPQIDRGPPPRQASRPQPINEHAHAIPAGAGFVRSLDLHHVLTFPLLGAMSRLSLDDRGRTRVPIAASSPTHVRSPRTAPNPR